MEDSVSSALNCSTVSGEKIEGFADILQVFNRNSFYQAS
jgi:hypothetical protein